MDKLDYCNNMLVRLEELLYHELSGCAAWKGELVGVDFIQAKNIQGSNEDEVMAHCIKEIIAGGLVEKMDYSIAGEGILLSLSIKGCVHLPKEIRLKKNGIKPYICPIANMLLDQLIEKLSYETTYLARLDIDEKTGGCTVKCAIYKTPDKIGLVSDWSNEAL